MHSDDDEFFERDVGDLLENADTNKDGISVWNEEDDGLSQKFTPLPRTPGWRLDQKSDW